MTALISENPYMSRFTLALLDSAGWYEVDYSYAESSIWGKAQGCISQNLDNCELEQFCQP